jgi:Protein of unknown function (DUF2975)
MNANDISPKANARLNRIRIVSRLVRYAFLALFIVSIIFFFSSSLYWPSSSPSSAFRDNTWRALCMVALQIVLCVWYWELAQLFRFYERGLIFAPEAIRCIKILGFLCVINWTIMSAWNTLTHLFPPPASPVMPMPPTVVVEVAKPSFRMGFFSLSYGGINLGMLLAGTVIILIAWIMDEGRKIQEEQELTV